MTSIINADDGSISGRPGLRTISGTSANLQIQVNGTTVMNVSSNHSVTFNSTVHMPSIVSPTLETMSLSSNSVSDHANQAFNAANTKLASAGGTITGNLQIDGNLIITGTTTTVSANNLVVKDNMFYLNDQDYSSNVDLGFAGNYNDGTYRHTGLFRDASDGIWKFYDNYLPEPDAAVNIDTSNTSFRIATVFANVKTDVISVRGMDPLGVANSAFNAANTAVTTGQANVGAGLITTTAAYQANTGAGLLTRLPLAGGTLTGASTVAVSTWAKWTLETTGVSARARQGSDSNGLNFTTNALWTGSAWAEDDSTKKKFAYIQHLGNGRHEFRTANTGTGISWVTSLTVDDNAVNSGVALQQGGNQVLHAGNYNSYALPLTGGSLSGVLTINSTNDNQLLLQSSDSWTGIGFNDSAVLGTDFIWHNGANGTFSIGGGGANVANKKLHVDGGMTIGANYDSTANPTNGLNVEGAIQQAGNQVLHASNYTSYSPTLTGGSASGTWGINITGNAATVNSKASSAFHQRVHFGTQNSQSSGYYKVRILAATSWMLSFTIRIYQGYQSFDLRVSGYNYGGNYWYSPEASLMDSTATSIEVRFGYDSAYNLWVAVPANNYTGIDVLNVVNGYTQFDGNYADQFAIEYQASLTGTVQNTVTAYRPLKYTETATNSTLLEGYGWFSSGKNLRATDIYADSWIRNYNTNTGLYNQATGSHWYSENAASFTLGSPSTSYGELRLRQNHQGTYKGSFYWDGSGIGILNEQGGWSVRCNYGTGYGGTLFGTWTGGNIRANRANGNFYIDDNYGNTVVGVYSSVRYQGVFAMGDAYKLPADGTGLGTLYGMAWSHPNAGGAAGNLTDHGLLIINNGSFRCAISNSIVASGNITAYSDERLKTNWRDMPPNFVARLAQVKVGVYDRIDEENGTQVGVSAQSFQQLLPQAIITAKDEIGTLSVSYGNAALASAVELAKDNVELRARIERLETLIEQLLHKE